MAHLSGFDGSIAGDLELIGEIGFKIESFDVDSETDVIEARAKGEADYTRFAGATKWQGQILFLIQDNAILSTLISGGVFANIQFVLISQQTDLALVGTGFISAIKNASPIDGPGKGTATLMGNGALAQATGVP